MKNKQPNHKNGNQAKGQRMQATESNNQKYGTEFGAETNPAQSNAERARQRNQQKRNNQ
ncbi:hypothetical protein [Jeotgalibacillus marinus]|uniref:Small, acid-soluble spore protein gamma-type n=1 Tax=Jeotgalibacillus marinus TaxID=86667 RepID=A0ABV3Q0Z3_9BACL